MPPADKWYLCQLTFIFSNVLESEGEACILSFDYAYLAKRSFADDTEETEMIEIHYEDRGQSSQVCMPVTQWMGSQS